MEITWVVWNHLATSKFLGKVTILDLAMPMKPHRFSLYARHVLTFTTMDIGCEIVNRERGHINGRTTISASQ